MSIIPYSIPDLKQWFEQVLPSEITWQGNEGRTRCPLDSHGGDDKKPSFSVNAEKGQYYCHAEKIGGGIKDLAQRIGVEPPFIRLESPSKKTKEIRAKCNYSNEDGQLIYQVVRYNDKTFSQRRPDGTGGWIWKMKGIEPVPYMLVNLNRAIKAGEMVFIVEGEKDVESLISLGLTATCNHGGAGKWKDNHSKYFPVGTNVIILPDNDEVGRLHAVNVANQLSHRGCSVKIVELPGLREKGDVSDWITAGGTVTELMNIIQNVPTYMSVIKAEPVSVKKFPLDSIGAAERFVHYFGDELHYSFVQKCWYIWDGSRWQNDNSGKINEMAKSTVKRIITEALSESDHEYSNLLLKHASHLNKHNARKNLIEDSKSISGIPILPEQLDKHQWKLNCQNGTLNLENGKLEQHSRKDLITKIIPISYSHDAKCPTWMSFIERAMSGQQHLIDYLQLVIGISLTGVPLKKFFFVYGPPNTGKSKLVETIRKLSGEYGKGVDIDVLMANSKPVGGGPNPELARLFGARVVVASETSETKRINEALIKRMTGSDVITVRTLHAEPFDFVPYHKLWIHGNFKPIIKAEDEGLWERLVLIPFNEVIPKNEQDPQLQTKFDKELPGILAWAAKGIQRWVDFKCQEPKPPSEFQAVVSEYREAMDTFAQFLDECCLLAPDVKTKVSGLYDAYKIWCEQSGEIPMAKRAFGLRLSDRGFSGNRGTGGTRYWIGIKLLKTT